MESYLRDLALRFVSFTGVELAGEVLVMWLVLQSPCDRSERAERARQTRAASGTHVVHPAPKGASKLTQEARRKPEECVRSRAGETAASTAFHETPSIATKRHIWVIMACRF